MKRKIYALIFLPVFIVCAAVLMSSSHREAPLIADDPQADNTDLYAFRSPDNQNTVSIIANYYPGLLPQGGPIYYTFGENIRYEIHIDNNLTTPGDDIIYRFTFTKVNQDPTTFFRIRLGQENQKTSYKLERSINGGTNFTTIVAAGTVPPPNIGPRSISGPVGLNAPNYQTLMTNAITTATTGEKVFCGTADDPFFVDLGGIFDLGDAPRTTGTPQVDGLKCKNVCVIALQIDIRTLQKDGKSEHQQTSILDPDFVIGVWASASRPKLRTLLTGQEAAALDVNPNDNETPVKDVETGAWVQVSRLGMPLTNEVVIPIGYKDYWNRTSPYDAVANAFFNRFLYNPEPALYMDDAKFGGAIPALAKLRIQKNSLGSFGFGNDQDGLFPLKGMAALNGTALANAAFGNVLLPAAKSPRSVDLFPIFHLGVPNLPPYQLLTAKANGNPLAPGKPFINNFLPNGGDMLRLNMAVQATQRNNPLFSSEGLVSAAAIGLTHPAYSNNGGLQDIPNMDGFPNGRRLEDDATLIELQAVSGIVLAVLGLGYDDYTPGPYQTGNPGLLTPKFLNVLNYRTGVNANDVAFTFGFPYVHAPFPGTNECLGSVTPPASVVSSSTFSSTSEINSKSMLNLASPEVFATTSPNPFTKVATLRYRVETAGQVALVAFDVDGNMIKVLSNKKQDAGTYTVDFNGTELPKGVYFIQVSKNGSVKQTLRLVKG